MKRWCWVLLFTCAVGCETVQIPECVPLGEATIKQRCGVDSGSVVEPGVCPEGLTARVCHENSGSSCVELETFDTDVECDRARVACCP